MRRCLAVASAAALLSPFSAFALETFPLPVGYWSFDLCDPRGLDDSTTQAHATAREQATCDAAGLYGSAARLDGTGDRFEATDVGPFTLGTAMTVSAWVKPNGFAGSQAVVNQWYGKDSWLLSLEGQEAQFAVVFPVGTWGTGVIARAHIGSMEPNNWIHIAGVYTGEDLKLYVNGSELKVVPRPANLPATIQPTTRPISIGNNPWQGAAGPNGLNGLIDEVKLFNVALTHAQVQSLAATPALSTRGLHLYASAYPYLSVDNYFARDLDILQTIGNVNSVKTNIFSFAGHEYQADMLNDQKRKLREIKAAVGNHATFVLRAEPAAEFNDIQEGVSWEDRGRAFATRLASTLLYARNELKLQHLFVEVGNEPNLKVEYGGWVEGASPSAVMDNYNAFFHGFYLGLQAENLGDVPLVYAGLSPGSAATLGTASEWYKNPGVRQHIISYAARIGVHTYWAWPTENGVCNSSRERAGDGDGRNYRTFRNLLEDPQWGPVSGRMPMIITEFNSNKQQYMCGAPTPNLENAHAADYCEWWRQQNADAAAYGVEQALVYMTSSDDEGHHLNHSLSDDHLDDIQNCR
ncbi:LamG domain-containing protein [Pyxidicoccus xibeiensis]|uniref:LamG domain-containing protein n=1 Tax=Pyxidicoccus xibeiensis TaxID=2906759 RepID=UPI0020A7B660|nr:LamG domain-containing protein [Pyxidicoccus xibeiensis]MCP3144126.1 LamG domain-containing protein [Pyxidicoccus xibeiensis]